MANNLSVERLEASLKKKQDTRRIAIAIVAILMIIIGITCVALREASREVIVNDIGMGLQWETVIYDDRYIPGIVFGFAIGITTIALFICDLILCRFETLEVNGHYLTVYRGAVECVVYINGEEAGRLELFETSPVVEVRMPDNVKVNVTFCRSWVVMAHISFSDNNPSVDL